IPFLPDYTSSSQGIRKRKHSDDPTTAVASGASTPGHHASSPPSQSASTTSTPPSSVPSTSASPCTVKPVDGDDSEQLTSDIEHGAEQILSSNGSTRQMDDINQQNAFKIGDNDESGPSTPTHQKKHAIVIADEDEDEDVIINSQSDYSDRRVLRDRTSNRPHQFDGDLSSNQADDECSVVEVYGGSPRPSEDSSQPIETTSRKRRQSPAPTILSEDSDITITPATVNRTSRHHEQSSGSRRRKRRNSGNDNPDVEEVLEIIDLTRPERRSDYPRGDSLPRVPGLTSQHSFILPTLQRLVSRSSESMERSQSRRANNSGSTIDVHEILDDDDDDQEDRFGNNTIRIDSEVREVQLDPHHPWSRGPIQLILSPDRQPDDNNDQYLEGQQQRRLEEAILVEDHLAQTDYPDVLSEHGSEEAAEAREAQTELVEIEDDAETDEQIQAHANWILNLRSEASSSLPSRRPMPPAHQSFPSSFSTRSRSPSFGSFSNSFISHSSSFAPTSTSRSNSFASPTYSFHNRSTSFEAPSFSYEAHPSTFPTPNRRSATPITHRFSPVSRRPSPVPLVLQNPTRPMATPPPPSRSSTAPLFNSKSSMTASSKVAISDLPSDPDESSVSESWVRQHLKCSICMDVMIVPTMVRCGHAFCRECIHRALDGAKICPMCRFPTNKTKLQELEFFVGHPNIAEGGEPSGGPLGPAGDKSSSSRSGLT
ncbi:hypothetical protein BGZ76_002795, partial [Entomortierella beljakovae]